MFYYLEGKVAHVEPYLAVIDCGGVGYACRTTNHTIRQLKKASAGGAALGSGSKAAEAAAALAVLGYTQQDISTALKGVDVETLPLEEIVRQSLKKMVK